MTAQTSTAATIAEQFQNDGLVFRTQDGTNLDDVCRERASNVVTDGFDKTRYGFADGSSLVVAGAAWDLGLPGGCFCWAEANWGRHADDCPVEA